MRITSLSSILLAIYCFLCSWQQAEAGILFPQDTIRACGTSYTLTAAAGFTGYQWNTGATTQSITVTRSSWYSCSVIQNGARVKDSVFLNLLYVNIINDDTTVCPNTTVTLYAQDLFNFSCTGYPSQFYSTWTNIAPYLGIIYKVNGRYYIRTLNDVYTSSSLNGPWTSLNFPGNLFAGPTELLGVDATGRLHVGTLNNGTYIYNGSSWSTTPYLPGIGTGGQFFTLLPNGRIIISKTGSLAGIYYSNDNGNTWQQASAPAGTWLSITLADNGNLFAVGANGAIRSTDGGITWTSLNSQLGGITSATGVTRDCNGVLWMMADRTFYRSDDNGITWIPTGSIPSIFTTNPAGGTLLATSNGEIYYFGFTTAVPPTLGLFVTRDGGLTWTLVANNLGTISYLKEIDGQLVASNTSGIYALTLQPTLTYLWSNGATTPITTVTPSQTTKYYVTVSNGISSCTDSVNITVTVPVIPNAGRDTINCIDSTLQLSSNGINGYWSVHGTNGTALTFQNINDPVTVIKTSQFCDAYTLVWHELTGSCEATDTVIVGFEEPPVDPTTVVCPPTLQRICGKGMRITPSSTRGPICSSSGGCPTRTAAFQQLLDSLNSRDTQPPVVVPSACHWVWYYVGDIDTIPPTAPIGVIFVPDSLTEEVDVIVSDYGDYEFEWICPGGGGGTGGTGSISRCDYPRIIRSRKRFRFLPNKLSTEIISYCLSEFPVTWNGISVPGPGVYSFSTMASNGCDSTITLLASAKANSFSYETIFLCPGSPPFSWNGMTITSQGSYQYITTGSNGCDSTATLFVDILSPVAVTVPVSLCPGSLPYTWNNIIIPTAGSYDFITTGSNGCDSIVTLIVMVLPYVPATIDESICPGKSVSIHGVTYSQTGTYYDTIPGTIGCDTALVINITMLPYVISGTVQKTICSNELPYPWNGINITSPGSYSDTIPGLFGCDTVETILLDTLPVARESITNTVCSNELPFIWNGQNISAIGIYTHISPGSNGCDSITTLTVNTIPLVNPLFSPIPAVCAGDFFTLPATSLNGITGTWSPSINRFSTTDYIFTPDPGQCATPVTMRVFVNQWVIPVFSPYGPYCQNEIIQQPVLPLMSNNGIMGSWNPQLISTLVPGNNFYLFDPIPGQCALPVSLNITVKPTVFGDTVAMACDVFSWHGNSYTSTPAIAPTHTYRSALGCDSIVTLQLTINPTRFGDTTATACDFFTWHGNTYNSTPATAPTHVYPSAAGCDSIVTLHLTINPTRTGDTTASACNSFIWHGITYNTTPAIPPTHTYPAAAGCDSIVTLHLTINPTRTGDTTASACNSFIWHGITYNATPATAPTHIYPSVAGCDSIVTLHLTINTVSFGNITDVACNSYIWNGQTYTQSGSYTVAGFTGALGCDSSSILDLTINTGDFSTSGLSACNSYTWNGQTYTQSGVYSYVYLNAEGCTSADTLYLSISNGIPNAFTVAACGSYTWNSTIYTTSGDYLFAITTGGCNATDTLHLTISNGTYTASTQEACNSYTWYGNTYSNTGTYIHNYVNSSGCASADTLHLTIRNGTFNVFTETVCDTLTWNNTLYNQSGTHLYYYSNSFGCASTDTLHLTVNNGSYTASNQNACDSLRWNNILYNQTGTYFYNYTNTVGCTSADTLYLTISTGSFAATDQEACNSYIWNGNTYSASGTYINNYTNAGGCASADTLHLIIRTGSFNAETEIACDSVRWNNSLYTQTDTYYYDYSNSFGCPSTDTLYLTINNGTFTAVNEATCDSFTWNNNTYFYSGTYYYDYTNSSGCPSADSLRLMVYPGPALGPDRNLSICFGETANITSLFNIQSLNTTWLFGQTLIPPPVSVSQPGNYYLLATDGNGCTDSASIALTVQPRIIADAGPDRNEETNVPFTLNGSGGSNCTWTPANVLNNPNSCSPQATIATPTTFILTIMDNYGCSDNDTVSVQLLNGPEIYVPNAFTPNGDGLNDEFGATAVGITQFEYFRIYNRFGELIFETSRPNNKWNGYYKGKLQNSGNFLWIISAKDRNGKSYLRKGNVLLIR